MVRHRRRLDEARMSRVTPARGLTTRGRLASVATAVRAASPAPSSVPATSLSALAQRVLAAVPALAGAMTLHRFWTMPAAQRPLFVVADGMGVDSLAMLVGLQRLGLRPDFVLHADTGDEHPATVAYREERRRWLRSIGFPGAHDRAPRALGLQGDGAPLCDAGREVPRLRDFAEPRLCRWQSLFGRMESPAAGRMAGARAGGPGSLGERPKSRQGDWLRRGSGGLAPRSSPDERQAL